MRFLRVAPGVNRCGKQSAVTDKFILIQDLGADIDPADAIAHPCGIYAFAERVCDAELGNHRARPAHSVFSNPIATPFRASRIRSTNLLVHNNLTPAIQVSVEFPEVAAVSLLGDLEPLELPNCFPSTPGSLCLRSRG
jgi:hypothetical protein